MSEASVRARCSECGRGLSFEEWQRLSGRCSSCLRPALAEEGEGHYVDLVDEVSDELLDELLDMLREEEQRRAAERALSEPAVSVDPSLPFAVTEGDLRWAVWGFIAGFGANAVLAKAAQLQSGAPFAEIVAPLLLGGVTAGLIGAVLGWAVAKVRER